RFPGRFHFADLTHSHTGRRAPSRDWPARGPYLWSRWFWCLWLRLAVPPRRRGPAGRAGARAGPPSARAAATAGAAGAGGGGRRARYVPWSGRAGAVQHWTFDAAIGNHGDRPRRSPKRWRPQERHGVAGFHQRNDFDDASHPGIHDHPHFFTSIIDRTHGVG